MFVLREALLATLCTSSASQVLCIFVSRSPRLYTKEYTWDVLMPLLSDFVETDRAENQDALLDGSELSDIYCSALLKRAVGWAAFDIDWDLVRDEAKLGPRSFLLVRLHNRPGVPLR